MKKNEKHRVHNFFYSDQTKINQKRSQNFCQKTDEEAFYEFYGTNEIENFFSLIRQIESSINSLKYFAGSVFRFKKYPRQSISKKTSSLDKAYQPTK